MEYEKVFATFLQTLVPGITPDGIGDLYRQAADDVTFYPTHYPCVTILDSPELKVGDEVDFFWEHVYLNDFNFENRS
jgi:hypothetical protein